MRRDPRELSTAEAYRLTDQIERAAPQVFVLTGGDPMNRPDLLQIVEYAAGRGLRVAMSPSATPRFLRTDLGAFRAAGLRRISLSIDGATRETHDAFRGVRGTWDWTMRAAEAAWKAGIEVQINTAFTRANLCEIDGFLALLETMLIALWSIFLLVPTGRGALADLPEADAVERLFDRLAEEAQRTPFDIKTTEGQHFRRVAWQRWNKHGGTRKPAPFGTNDGKGFVFVSHVGEINPSGFLPLAAGNVRHDELVDVYRDSPIFRELRDPDRLKGKCGRCEFRSLCGGSRARAFGVTGDFLASEPLCTYQPGPERQPLFQ